MVKIQLSGCDRYNYKSELYEKGKVYIVGEAKAAILLRDKDDYDRPYFTPYQKPTKSKAHRVAEAAAAAAAKAATAAAEEIVTRPDGSEQQDDVVIAVEQPEEIVVDKDDDPSLDDEDADNPEEFNPDEEEDRDDGSAVQV